MNFDVNAVRSRQLARRYSIFAFLVAQHIVNFPNGEEKLIKYNCCALTAVLVTLMLCKMAQSQVALNQPITTANISTCHANQPARRCRNGSFTARVASILPYNRLHECVYALIRKYVVIMILLDWPTQKPIVCHTLAFQSLKHNQFKAEWNYQKCALEDKGSQLKHHQISLSLGVEGTHGSRQTNQTGECASLFTKCPTVALSYSVA